MTIRPLTLVALVTFIIGTGCQFLPQNLSEITSTPSATWETRTAALSNLAQETPTANPTQTPSPSPTMKPSATPSLTPTATELPEFKVLAPDKWQTQVQAVIARLNERTTTHVWSITTEGPAAISLTQNEGPYIVAREPIVLAVPFTTEWEGTTEQMARDILANGHELVSVKLWSEMTPELKALRIDGRHPTDSDYVLQEIWSLQVAAGFEPAAVKLQSELAAELKTPMVHLAAVGDIMLDRSLGYALEQGSLDFPFARVINSLRSADITVGNVESALGDLGQPAAKRYPFRAPPEAAESLARAGFDVVSLANNHAMDFGAEALLEATSILQENDIAVVGAGADIVDAHNPAIIEVGGLKIAFFGYVDVPVEAISGFDTASWQATANAPGLAWADPQKIESDIQAIEDEVDVVVVILHSGFEYVAAPSEPQVTAARAAINAGADLVIGHHAHILQGIEFQDQGTIIYGTGNFAFEIDGPPETAIFHIWLDRDGVHQIAIEPAIIQFGGQPRLAESWEAPAILSQIYYLSNLLNAK